MNCQELALLLDDRDISRLSEVERARVGSHLIACPDCARDWELQLRLIAAPVPPMPADLAASCRVLVAASGPKGTSSRTILFGSVLFVAAAAAMLVMRLMEPGHEPAAVLNVPVPVSAPAVEPAVPAPPEEVAPAPVTVRAELPAPFTVYVPPLRHASEDPLARAYAQRYQEKLLEGLRAVPDITVIGPQAANPAGADPDVRISVTSLWVRRFEISPIRSMAQWSAMVDIRARRSGGPATATTITEYEGAQVDPECLPQTGEAPEMLPCRHESAIAVAVRRVEALRIAYLPDSAIAREVQERLKAQMADRTLDMPTRLKAFSQLVQLRGASVDANTFGGNQARRRVEMGHGSGLGWDSATVRGALELLDAADPPLRLAILRMLRGIEHPDLVPGLIALLQHTDHALREEAATILTLDFDSDPAAQAALASMASADSSQIIHQLAERARDGGAAWRGHVHSTAMDTNLPTAERLRPSIEMLDFFTHDDALAIVGKQDVVMELVKLLQELWSSNQDTLLVRKSIELLRKLDYLSGGSRPDVREAIVNLNAEALRKCPDREIRLSAINWLGSWAINPRPEVTTIIDRPHVIEAAEYAAANDPDPQVKSVATHQLGIRAARLGQQPEAR